MALCGFFVAKMPVRPELAVISSVFVVLFALPSYLAAIRWLGAQRAARLLIALGVFAIVLESFAVATGVPYGRFIYGDKIGAKVLGLVPWTVPFAWTPLLLASMTLAARWSRGTIGRAVWSGLVLVAIDLVLDPAAVDQGFWTWQHPGSYYQVPASNFVGWFLSGVAGSLLFQWMAPVSNRNRPPLQMLGSAFLILCFWTSVCGWSALWVPAVLGAVLLLLVGTALMQREPSQARVRTEARMVL